MSYLKATIIKFMLVLVLFLQSIAAFALGPRIVGHWKSEITKADGHWEIDWEIGADRNYYSSGKGTTSLPDEYERDPCVFDEVAYNYQKAKDLANQGDREGAGRILGDVNAW